MYDSGYDAEADLIANKGLHIIFIIAILLANGLLIFNNVRKGDVMYKPKTLTILSLSIGDVLMALFPMVVATRMFFGDFAQRTMPCSLITTYTVYMPYLITFVYGLGLMVLGLEIVQHHKISSLSKNSKLICSLIASSIPWILGLIIILPLGLANIDMDTCENSQTIDQFKALIVLGILLPACGAVITSIIAKCIDQILYLYQQLVSSHPQVMVDLNTHTMAYANAPHNEQQGPTPTTPGNPHPRPSTLQAQTYAAHMQFPNSQRHVKHMYNLPSTQPYALPAQPHYIRSGNQNSNSFIVPTPLVTMETAVEVPIDTTQRRNRLLVISIIYFILVTPLAIFHLGYLNPDVTPMGVVASVTIGNIVYWLNVIRSVITPLIMHGYSDN
ncbi:unnamed protein product [Lymnaea stagnalis]|uniref:G-protein coupled receptors family 1 profile domain-containing protein n=1 Tax=Lymnaea stagnalis TaxID=6523 RepID=A0AAV2IIH4_LYMST